MRPTTLSLLLLAGALSVALPGCFNPQLEDEGFSCNPQAPDCPDEFPFCVDVADGEGTFRCSSAAATTSGPPTLVLKVPDAQVKVGERLKIQVLVTNFKLVNPPKAPVPGEGHVHLYLDSEAIYLGEKLGEPGAPAFEANVERAIPLTTTPGPQTILGILRENDHSELKPRVEAKVAITVNKRL